MRSMIYLLLFAMGLLTACSSVPTQDALMAGVDAVIRKGLMSEAELREKFDISEHDFQHFATINSYCFRPKTGVDAISVCVTEGFASPKGQETHLVFPTSLCVRLEHLQEMTGVRPTDAVRLIHVQDRRGGFLKPVDEKVFIYKTNTGEKAQITFQDGAPCLPSISIDKKERVDPGTR